MNFMDQENNNYILNFNGIKFGVPQPYTVLGTFRLDITLF